jgi:CheY-like chemotaxis protein
MNPVTILFIDDDKDDLFLLEHCYKKAELTTPAKFLEAGKAAVEFLTPYMARSKASFESFLVFLDLNMPGMSGFEFLVWLREQAALREIPVVILSTSENPADIKKAYELGANAYLVKSHSTTELVQLLSTAHRFWVSYNRCAS